MQACGATIISVNRRLSDRCIFKWKQFTDWQVWVMSRNK